MAKIQCPHCKAVNQDVSLNDPCWQCGTVLGAPVSALDTGTGAATSEANPNVAGSISSAPVQQVERDRPDEGAPIVERPQPSSPGVGKIVLAITIVALIVIVIVFYFTTRH
jgi:hypothetical protein